MSRFPAAEIAFFLVTAVSVAAQTPPPVNVLEMPSGAKHQPAQHADQVVSIHYDGSLNPARDIWVRVFRGSVADLENKIPRLTPHNKCAVYTQLVVLHVDHGLDRELRVGDLEDYFAAARFDYDQTFTLIFEQGGNPSRSEPLYLEKTAVKTYFDSGVEVPMDATQRIDATWKNDAADDAKKLAASKSQPRSFWSWVLGIEPSAHAAVDTSTTSGSQPQQAAEPSAPEPHCQSVKPVPYRALAGNPASPKGNNEALAPVFQLQNTACGE